MTSVRAHGGWEDDNVRVQDARRPFSRRLQAALQVDGLPLVTAAPSERRMAAGIEAQSYYTYPLLFYPLFPEINLEQLNSLSLCGSFLFDYVLCLDRLLDRSPHGDAGTLLLAARCQREGLTLLQPLFPAGHKFWDHYEQFELHFSQALLRERARHHCLVTPYETSALEFIYAGKPAIAKAALAALGLLSQREDRIAPLCASHDAFYVAFQLIDDVLDWRVDYQSRHYSYPLTYAFQTAGWAERVEGEPRPSLEEVAELLASADVVGHVRNLALGYLERAEAPLVGLPDSAWGAAIRKIRGGLARLEVGGAAVPAAPAKEQAGNVVAWPDSPAEFVAPLTHRWAPWLDARRVPAQAEPALVELQQRVLRSASGAASLGHALGQLGLAIEASRRQFPEAALGAQLGLAPGELEWCRGNKAWLQTLLATASADPPWLWTPAEGSPPAQGGWMPLAVGRYLAYQLVRDYPLPVDPERSHDPAQVEALLLHYRRQLVA